MFSDERTPETTPPGALDLLEGKTNKRPGLAMKTEDNGTGKKVKEKLVKLGPVKPIRYPQRRRGWYQ